MATALEIFRDYVVDGVPASGANKPVKADIRSWGTGLEDGIKGVHNADIPSATTLNLTPAAGELVDVTGTTTITAITLPDGNECTVRFTGALTLTHGASLVLPGAANILTVAGDYAIFRGYAAGVVRCVAYIRADGRALIAPSQGALLGAGAIINGTIDRAVAANAITFSLKTLAGTDPSSSDPVLLCFRNATPGTGNFVYRTVTAALSLTVSSGSTLGASSATAFNAWLVLFDDAGTIRMGAINCLSGTNIYPLGQFPIASSTAEGGAGAADSAHVFYTGAAVTSKPYLVLGYASYQTGLTTAGTWDANPTRIHLQGPNDPLPGALIQSQRTDTGAVATGTTVLPDDDTIPQNTEGFEVMTQAITPTSKTNVFEIAAQALSAHSSTGGVITMAIFQDTTAGAAAAMQHEVTNTNDQFGIGINYRMAVNVAAGSATTFRARIGNSSAGTTTFNGSGAARKLGGVMNSFLGIAEFMA